MKVKIPPKRSHHKKPPISPVTDEEAVFEEAEPEEEEIEVDVPDPNDDLRNALQNLVNVASAYAGPNQQVRDAVDQARQVLRAFKKK
jgi:hypothetical protein